MLSDTRLPATAGNRRLRRLIPMSAAALAVFTAACSAGNAASAAGKANTGAEQFQVMITSTASFAKSGVSSLIATGVIAGGGRAVTINYGNAWTATFRLPGGSFRVAQSAGSGTQHLDRATCIYTQHWHGTFKVSHGTGRYAGISGHGTYQLDWLMAVRHGTASPCALATKPIAIQQLTRFSGNISF